MIHNKISVLLADDHPSTRAGLRTILNKALDIQVIGEAESGFQVKEMVAKLHPDILLLDLVMPGPTPGQLEEWIRTNCPETLTLVLTAHDRDVYLTSMMDAGASGFLSKTETGEKLTLAIRRAMSGDTLFTEEQIARINGWRQETGKKWENLTKRERQILFLIARGGDNKGIAKALNITVKTTSYHVTNLLKKLDVKSRQEAMAWVYKYFPDNLEC